MRKFDTRSAANLALAAAGFGALIAIGPAWAQSLDTTTSCIAGNVPANDYAELSASFRETYWDRRAGVALVSEISGLQLFVVDDSNTSVCADTANNTTKCDFKLRTSDNFYIRIDNVANAVSTRYKLCAY